LDTQGEERKKKEEEDKINTTKSQEKKLEQLNEDVETNLSTCLIMVP
jgi:hypothetical protein